MKLEMVYVEWIDSCAKGFWHALKEATALSPDHCCTVGFLVNETEEFITLSGSHTNRVASEEDQADASICIPKIAITRRVEAVEKE
jgi:hypothetical protein